MVITRTHTPGAAVRRDGWPQQATLVRVLGLVIAAMGAEHGVGELLQGDRRLAGPVIQSWPDSPFFRIEAGEPAFTLLPHPVAAGVLTLAVATLFAVRVWFIDRGAHPRRDVLALSVVLFLVGGGSAHPTLGVALALPAGWVHRPSGPPQPPRGGGRRGRRPGGGLSRSPAGWPWCRDCRCSTSPSAPATRRSCPCSSRPWPSRSSPRWPPAPQAAVRPRSTHVGIAERIAEVLTQEGLSAQAVPVESADPPENYDAVVLGGAAYMFHWLKPALQYAHRHRAALSTRSVWLLVTEDPSAPSQVDAEGNDALAVARPREFDELTQSLLPRGERVFFGAFDPTHKPIGFGERVTRAMPAAPDHPARRRLPGWGRHRSLGHPHRPRTDRRRRQPARPLMHRTRLQPSPAGVQRASITT